MVFRAWNFDKAALGATFLKEGVFSHDARSWGSWGSGAWPAEDLGVELFGSGDVDDWNLYPGNWSELRIVSLPWKKVFRRERWLDLLERLSCDLTEKWSSPWPIRVV
jgi:hypothetical protein